jgi:hypothetical protein
MEARNMSSFYIDGPPAPQPRDDHEWLFLAYCHARAAGLPPIPVRVFCSRHLDLVPLGSKLTTEAVIRTYILPTWCPHT